jgi:hypothetical protein
LGMMDRAIWASLNSKPAEIIPALRRDRNPPGVAIVQCMHGF